MNERDSAERLLIFDCDGVLVDSEAVVIEIESKLLMASGFPLTADDIADTCVGLSYPDMMQLLHERFGKPVPDDLNQQIQAAALAAFPEQLNAVQGMHQLLSDNGLPRCIASSSNLDRIRLSLQITGIDQHFADPATIFSAQMVTRGKPAPDLFLHAAQQMTTEPARCTVIEDSPHGVEAALAANMQVIGFVGGLHARPSLTDRLHAAGAHETAVDSAHLASLLTQR